MEKTKREEYVIRVGPLLNKVLEQQIKSAKNATYDVVKISTYEAGEIIAKKVLGLT
jgi:hypothetical protein